MRINNLRFYIKSDVSTYVATRYLNQIFNLLIILFLAKYLSKSDFGIFSILLLISSYAPFSSLGVIPFTARKLPELLIEKRNEKFFTLKIASMNFVVLCTLIFSLLENVIFNWFFDYSTWPLLSAIFVLNINRSLSVYLHHYFRSVGDIFKLNLINVLPSLLSFLVILGFVFIKVELKLLTVISTIYLISIFVIIGITIGEKFFVKNYFPSKNQLKKSINYLSLNLISVFNKNIDRWFVIAIFPLAIVGEYNLAVSITNGIFLFIQSLESYIYPKSIKHVLLNESNKIRNYYLKGAQLSIIIIIISYILIVLGITNYYTDYKYLRLIIFIIVSSKLISILSFNGWNILLALNLEIWILRKTIILLISSVVVLSILTMLSDSIFIFATFRIFYEVVLVVFTLLGVIKNSNFIKKREVIKIIMISLVAFSFITLFYFRSIQ